MPHHTDSQYTLGRAPAAIADDAVSGLLSPNYEMMTTLTWVAGFTERVKLGTAVAVLPIRNAVANARQLATLDVYSGGRVLYGAGVGWLREEAEMMNMLGLAVQVGADQLQLVLFGHQHVRPNRATPTRHCPRRRARTRRER